ncbi:hypothetical protein ACFQ3P_33205 [Paraburkholderia sabiae]|uniref:Uncharacterized protein n=1 Tax=Paraburkholderia sabiae TaxID=273251 RepID=A0ABU9QJR3_9BURK|nr:hypothetical protein [Paraburkholderia sabiae]WJZ79812.1 hypothetical protein QEN71_44035 [Paraburkholderia sabiae]
MQDFAHLFSDSVAAWLRGRGDFRFQRYERHYLAGRSAAQDAGSFDLERSNEQYAATCRRKSSYLAVMVDSKVFKRLMPFLIVLWGGSLLLPTIGKSQPVAAGVVLLGIFVALRIKARKGSARGRQQTVAR